MKKKIGIFAVVMTMVLGMTALADGNFKEDGIEIAYGRACCGGGYHRTYNQRDYQPRRNNRNYMPENNYRNYEQKGYNKTNYNMNHHNRMNSYRNWL